METRECQTAGLTESNNGYCSFQETGRNNKKTKGLDASHASPEMTLFHCEAYRAVHYH